MSAALTVADSKRAFHAAFPHVIAPLYRRMVDELLVELHLLSHQKGFQADPLFAVGLVQVFEGLVIGKQGGGVRETFRVRKLSFGVGVERTFPVHSPITGKLELVTRGDVRRAKLYYLRDRIGKAAKIKEKR